MLRNGLTRRELITLTAKYGVAGSLGAAAIWRGQQWLRSRDPVPVLVIGSGAAGIASCLALLEQGLPVAMMEAGLHDASGNDANSEAYQSSGTTAFPWHRTRRVGGKLTEWLAHCPRFSAADFDGQKLKGFRWPIRYEEIAPYYTRAERILGVVGEASGEPDLPDGEYPGAFRRRAYEEGFGQSLADRGLLLTQGRYAVYPDAMKGSRLGTTALTREAALESELGFFRPGSTFSDLLLPNSAFSLIPGAQALRIEIDSASNRPEAVTYLDRATGRQESLRVESIVLAAGCLESTKLLLHSATQGQPAGLGNGSGMLGRYLTDHPQGGIVVQVRKSVDVSELDDGGIPRAVPFGSYLHAYTAAARREAPELSGMFGFQVHGYETEGKTLLALYGMAAMEPRPENRMRLTGKLTENGVPIPDLAFGFTAEDQLRHAKMMRVAGELLQEFDTIREINRFSKPSSIHYAGTCRMGEDPSTSVCDAFGALHENPLVHVADAGVFVSLPEKNPTLTLMALAWRSAEQLAKKIGSPGAA
ncbi:MAG: GMC family oxidoreductase [bacterium]|nr:GMC family oxidoreductase [bacterium]